GLVASLARPGGNVTGLSVQQADIAGKRLELLREVVPGLRRVAIMANAGFAELALEIGELQATARTLGLEVAIFEIRRAEDIAPAFEALKKPSRRTLRRGRCTRYRQPHAHHDVRAHRAAADDA